MKMGKAPVICIGIGVAIVALAIVLGWFAFPSVVQSKIREQVRLVDGGETFNKWKNIPVPIYMKVYIFNTTNPEDVVRGEKPIFNEVGPYIYQQKRQKIVEAVNLENDTVQFRPKITYHFRPDLSVGTEEDTYIFLNIPFISVAQKSFKMDMVTRYIVVDLAVTSNQGLFVKKSVGEFFFRGYVQPMIKELSAIEGKNLMPNNSFGLFYGKNATPGDLLEIYSGVKDNTKFGKTITWQGEHNLDIWDDKYCNMINGSDGSIFPPFLNRDRVLRIFSNEMCRSIYMTYTEDKEVLGIKGYKFTTPTEVLEDARVNPENMCYCKQPGANNEGCTKRGVFQLSPCRKGAPIVASWPHFFGADEEYRNQCIGLQPNQSIHEAFIILEPNTGALLSASKRFQINVDLKPVKFFKSLKKAPNMIYPLIWVDESAGMNEDSVLMLQQKLLTPLKIADIATWTGIAVGVSIILITLILYNLPAQKKPFKA